MNHIILNKVLISYIMRKLYFEESLDSWEIAKLFDNKLNQTYISKMLKAVEIKTTRNNKTSKVHLRMKKIIEKLLGKETMSEVSFYPYTVDELCEEYKLCIEIDSEWCHDTLRDERKDTYLNSLGYYVVRIPSYSNEEEILHYLRRWVV